MSMLTTVLLILAIVYYTTGFFNNVRGFYQNFIKNKKGKNKGR